MKYIKTYENIITDLFKKKLKVIEPDTKYNFLDYVTINDITFKVGDYVKRKKDNKIGKIEHITRIVPMLNTTKKYPNEFSVDFGENIYSFSTGYTQYWDKCTFYDIYTDEETELKNETDKYNL